VITVFGSINFDLIGTVDRLPGAGETVPGSSFATAPGGKGANQALAAARAGGTVRMVGAVGRDDFAGAALALLRSDGVDLARVREVDGATGVALILVDRAGQNVIAVIPGANGTVAVSQAEALEFGEGDVLLLQLEVPAPAADTAARRAREQGATVLLNFAPFRADALDLLPHVTHLIVNESECRLIAAALGLTETSTADQAAALCLRLDSTIVATLGEQGVLAVEAGRIEMAAALPVDAVDTVGAGDTFCGYLAAAFSEGLPLGAALALATAAGSLACTRSGAQPAIPGRSEVEAALSGLSR
jgi:ribokinase